MCLTLISKKKNEENGRKPFEKISQRTAYFFTGNYFFSIQFQTTYKERSHLIHDKYMNFIGKTGNLIVKIKIFLSYN